DEPRCLRCRPSDVVKGEGEPFGEIAGELGEGGGGEDDGLACDVDLRRLRTYLSDAVDAERGEREGGEGGDAIAGTEAAVFDGAADASHATEEHAAGAGDAVVLLAALFDRFEDDPGNALGVAAGGFLHLP